MTIVELYISENGSLRNYKYFLEKGARRGQAFFNALSPEDQSKLRGHVLDTYFKDDDRAVERAVEFLMS